MGWNDRTREEEIENVLVRSKERIRDATCTGVTFIKKHENWAPPVGKAAC